MTWLLLLRHWRTLATLALVAVVVGSVWAWAAGKDRAIRRAEAQRGAAFVALVRTSNDLIMARVNVSTLRGAIDAQNEEIRRHSAESARRLQAAQEALREARRAMPRVVERVRTIRAPIVQTGELERFREVDRRVLEGLR